MSEYRALNSSEIQQLELQGCKCNNWPEIEVKNGFDAAFVNHTVFSGKVKLGVFRDSFNYRGGISKHSGISNARIHNTTIADNVLISNIHGHIANYHIESNVFIENIYELTTEGTTTFGNGQKIAILNEAGGRELTIFNQLSAQTAYILTFYRHRPLLIEKLETLINQYCAKLESETGTIQSGTRITNSGSLINVNIGTAAIIDGVTRLNNGTINSSEDHPSFFGPGVIAENFIAASGSFVSNASVITKCFIGQGCQIDKQFSAENSAFFANCQGFHGEACSIFAGPYTVTHHKSTLLIAGYYSFFNAGSGTNQSNHMYKLGPVHQGVVERGCKTTSDSYMLWPARIGAFSLIMGRHYASTDTSNLPFSYLIENQGKSYLAPGINLRSTGTMRDTLKWPVRDTRKDKDKLDNIIFETLSPYTIDKIHRGKQILLQLKDSFDNTSGPFMYNGVSINVKALDRGIRMYDIAIIKFMGNVLLNILNNTLIGSITQLRRELTAHSEKDINKWVDISGLIVPQYKVEELVQNIEQDKINTLKEIKNQYKSWFNQYEELVQEWALTKFNKYCGLNLNTASKKELREFIIKWEKSVIALNEMILEDVGKEFNPDNQTGFAIDGSSHERQVDFESVRGSYRGNSSVHRLRNDIEKTKKLAEKATQIIESLTE